MVAAIMLNAERLKEYGIIVESVLAPKSNESLFSREDIASIQNNVGDIAFVESKREEYQGVRTPPTHKQRKKAKRKRRIQRQSKRNERR